MTPQQLKNSILKRAMEGRLVPQRAEEGTAKELLIPLLHLDEQHRIVAKLARRTPAAMRAVAKIISRESYYRDRGFFDKNKCQCYNEIKM